MRRNKNMFIIALFLVVLLLVSYKVILPLPVQEPTARHNVKLSDEITLVTAYFKLPSFGKGSISNKRTPANYWKWMDSYKYILNKIVMYTDDLIYLEKFKKLRSGLSKHLTKLILLKRKDMWAFKLESQIAALFKQPYYPKHIPNTVIPAYTCTMNAKYELLLQSIKHNYFNTRYLMWIDIGYFREKENKTFGLSFPDGYNETQVMMSKVGNLNKRMTLKAIVSGNRNWVAGGAILGRHDVLSIFCHEYISAVEKDIKIGIIGADQQVIYGMFTDKIQPNTSLYLPCSGWFCLGDLTRHAWRNKHKPRKEKTV